MRSSRSTELMAMELYEPCSDVMYSIETTARLSHVSRHHIAVFYKHGLVTPVRDPRNGGWYFDDEGVRTLRRIESLRVDYGLNLDSIRLFLELRREVEQLRRELQFLRSKL